MDSSVYMVNFKISNITCRLTILTPEFVHAHHSRYYNHRHSFFEIHYVTDGQFVCKVEGQEYELGAGDLILIQPGCDHAIAPLTENKSKMCLGFEFFRSQAMLESRDEQEFVNLFYKEKVVLLRDDSEVSGGMSGKLLKLIRPMSSREKMSMAMLEEMKALTSLLLLNLHKELRQRFATQESAVLDTKNDRNYWIDEFFNCNFNRNDGYEKLAKRLNISTRQLDRLLRKNYGMGYQRMLIEFRLKVAVNLLCDTDKPIEEISQIVGYSSTSSFTAFIKRETNHTPSQIRKGVKQP